MSGLPEVGEVDARRMVRRLNREIRRAEERATRSNCDRMSIARAVVARVAPSEVHRAALTMAAEGVKTGSEGRGRRRVE